MVSLRVVIGYGHLGAVTALRCPDDGHSLDLSGDFSRGD